LLPVAGELENLVTGLLVPAKLKPTSMTQRVKSPVWAIVFLLICLILRFCDSWLFGERHRQKNFPHYQRFHPSHYRRVQSDVVGDHAGSGCWEPDSLAREYYFLR